MEGKDSKPVPPVEYVGTNITQNKVAIYATITVRDSNGNKFYFRASSFFFDLKPEHQNKSEVE